MRQAKSILVSKTFWFNLLSALGAIMAEVTNIFADTEFDTKWVLFAVAIINILLRYITTQPVEFKTPEGTNRL